MKGYRMPRQLKLNSTLVYSSLGSLIRLLHTSSCTDLRCLRKEDGDLPHLYAMGNTNLVGRHSLIHSYPAIAIINFHYIAQL